MRSQRGTNKGEGLHTHLISEPATALIKTKTQNEGLYINYADSFFLNGGFAF